MQIQIYNETGEINLTSESAIYINYCGYGVGNFGRQLKECLGEVVKEKNSYVKVYKLDQKDKFFKLLTGCLSKRSQGRLFVIMQSNPNYTISLW